MEERFDRDITFRTECSKVPPSLYIVQLLVSVNFYLLQEEDSLTGSEQDTAPWVQQRVI